MPLQEAGTLQCCSGILFPIQIKDSEFPNPERKKKLREKGAVRLWYHFSCKTFKEYESDKGLNILL